MRERDLRRRIDGEQRTRVAHVEIARKQHRLHGHCEVQKTQQVRHRAARAADRFGRLLVREAELVEQALDPVSLFERVQILALDVLDQRHGGRGLIGHVLYEHRHFLQPREARRTETALTRDDLVFV